MPKTLLLADDSVTIQKVVGLSFANEDVELITVDNGDDAVERARTLHPDLILADVVMPGLSGYEVCEAIRADEALAPIPVLLLSGTFEPFDEERAAQVGATGHIVKPFEAQALVSRVNELLNETVPAAAESGSAAPEFEDSMETKMVAPATPEPGELTQAFDAAFIADDPLAAPELALDDDSLLSSMELSASEFSVDDQSTYVLDVSDDPTSGLPEGIVPIAEALEDPGTSNPLEETVALSPENGLSFSTEEPSLVTNLDESDFGMPTNDPTAVSPVEEFTFPEEASPIENFEQAEAVPAAELVQDEIALDQEFPEISFSEEAAPIATEEIATEELEEIQAVEVATAGDDAFELAEPLAAEEDSQESWGTPEISMPVEEASAPMEPLEEMPLLQEEAVFSADPVQEVQTAAALSSVEAQQNVHDALEKIAWEAFGDVTERLVQETVKRVEQVAWEVIPQLAESLIKEEIQKLKEESTGE